MKFSTYLFRTCLLVTGLFAVSIARAQVPTITAISTPRQVVAIGQNLTLSVTATSGSTPSYQWKRNGFAISGATASSYTITGANLVRDTGWYQVVVSNPSGSTTSAVVFVNVSVTSAHVMGIGNNYAGQISIPAGLGALACVVAGYTHTLALKSDGTVVGWGSNGSGQATAPVGLTGVVAIAVGASHSLALKSDGTVVGWGYNGDGQITIPAGLGSVVAIAAGFYQSLALKSDGTVVAWGSNTNGQAAIPTGLANVAAIAAGNYFSVALKSDGTVVAWGEGNSGQTTIPSGLSGLVAIAAGGYHSLALTTAGAVVGWGSNGNGQLSVPIGLGNVVAVDAGNLGSFALKSDGTVATWGIFGSETAIPPSLAKVAGLSAGYDFTVFLRNGAGDTVPAISTQPISRAANLGEMVTLSVTVNSGNAPDAFQWRRNGTAIPGATLASYTIDGVSAAIAGNYDVVVTNYLGAVTSNAATLTVNSGPVVNATSHGRYVLTTGQNLTLALDSAISGSASVQWKRNGLPLAGATGRAFAITNASRLNAGCYQAVYNDGSGAVTSGPIFVAVTPTVTQIVGWGSNSSNHLAIPNTLNSATAVVSGYYSAALKADGTVAIWDYGYSSPSGLSNVADVAIGTYHYLALKPNGTVVQWGDTGNSQGAPPAGLSNVVGIAAGPYHSLAVKSDGTVVAWGNPNNGATAVPAGLTGVIAVAGGYGFSLALKSDGTVVGWGANGYGQSSVPFGLSGVIAISAGDYHSLALKADGTVVGWGATYNGQTSIPAGLGNVVVISARSDHNLAARSDGTVVAWGYNYNGESTVPTALNGVIGVAAGSGYSLALRDATADVAPSILAQPVNTSAFVGQNVTLRVTASGGTSILAYQWRKDGAALAGATNATLSFGQIAAADAGSYDVVVSNQFGSATSQAATITVNTGVAVSTNLTGQQVVAVGGGLTLTSTTALAGPVTYQWRRNGRLIAGATNSSLAISNASWRDTGAYQITVTNSVGPVTSAPVFVSVSIPTQVVAWGGNSSGQTNVPTGLGNVMAVAGGASHSLALKSDGTVIGWGGNGSNQINLPGGLAGVVAIAANSDYSMALKGDGSVSTWGSINYTPSNVTNVIAVAASSNYAVALRGDGTLAAWTNSASASDVPAGLNDVVAIAAGLSHRLAVRADGTVVGWGDNSSGQITIPAGLNGVINVAAGSSHSLALRSDGTVVAWGSNGNGQASVPAGLANVIAIAAATNNNTSFAVKSDGTIVAWGSTSNSLTSVPVVAGFFGIAGGGSHILAIRDASGDAAPTVTTQPVSVTVAAGQAVSFTVAATGAPAPTYQWRKNGAVISNATNATFSLSNPQASDAASYDVVISNYLGSATSNAAILTVNGAPLITTQPVAVSVGDGQPASFSVVAAGNPAPTYQWRKDTVNIPNATNATLSFAATHFADAGNYSVVVTNSFGSVTSSSVALSISGPPGIATQPAGQSVGLGGSLLLSVTATGSAPLSYQWQKNGTNIAGATLASLRFTDFQSSDAGDYTVIVTNSLGSVTSATATLTAVASTPPAIITQPVSGELNVGNVGALSVVATSSTPLFYQWRKNGTPISGATNATYILGQVQLGSGGNFDVVVSSAGGAITSAVAVVTINSPVPAFTTHPQSATVGAGTAITLTAAAKGVPTPTLQWRKNGVAISSGTALVFTAAQAGDAGNYDVVATNSAGTATSNVATLTVLGASPTILTQPIGGTVFVGGAITLSVNAVGAPTLAYQWRRDGFTLPGATSATLTIGNAQTFDAGDYTVVVSNGAGSATSATAHVSVFLKPVSISARLVIGSDGALACFLVEGTASKQLLLRAIGPGLAPFGVSGLMPDPQLEIYNSAGVLVATNNDWSAAANANTVVSTTTAVGAFALAYGSRDAAVLQTFAPGAYTVRATGRGGVGGVALLELYDVDAAAGGSTVPFVAVRGRVASGDGVLVGGLGSNGRGVKSFLIRAVGPTLGLADAFANPAFMVVRDNTLVGSNDDWDAVASDGAAVSTATARVAAFALPAGSRDAAVVLTGNLHAGAHTVQVGGPAGAAGVVLLELHDLQTDRPTVFAPLIVSPPVAQTLRAGDALALNVLAHGTGPMVYQWRKNGVSLDGATASSFALPSVQLSDGGSYDVIVTNAPGTSTSIPAVITVQSADTVGSAVHSVANGYTAGGTVVITNTLTYTGTATSLAWSATLPPGWSYAGGSNEGDVKPAVGATGSLGWTWSTPPSSPVTFSYTVTAPVGETGNKLLSASALVRNGATVQTIVASPSPLTIPFGPNLHSADSNLDFQISLFELTRVIELYNTRKGTSRTGCYKVDATGEDGFAPDASRASGSAVALTRYHSADTRGASSGTPRDGAIDLFELTRVIELYNYRSGTTRTGQYHVQAGTEDGFAPGP